MGTINITVPFAEEKLAVLNFSLQKENTTVQKRMESALTELYENAVPEPLREYIESKMKRPARPKAVKKPAESATPAVTTVLENEVTAGTEDAI